MNKSNKRNNQETEASCKRAKYLFLRAKEYEIYLRAIFPNVKLSNKYLLLALFAIAFFLIIFPIKTQSLDSLPLPPIKSNHTDLEIKSLDSTSITSNSWGFASFPVENFQRYTSPFGKRINPVTRKAQFHTGLDLAAPFGAYVRAWWGGQVVKLTSDKVCGIGITITSGSWQHVYCHLIGQVKRDRAQTYLVDREGGIILKLGQSVTTGAIIARVGMTGRTTGPHLHWGLKFNGNWVDPALILEQMYQERKYSSAGTRTSKSIKSNRQSGSL